MVRKAGADPAQAQVDDAMRASCRKPEAFSQMGPPTQGDAEKVARQMGCMHLLSIPPVPSPIGHVRRQRAKSGRHVRVQEAFNDLSVDRRPGGRQDRSSRRGALWPQCHMVPGKPDPSSYVDRRTIQVRCRVAPRNNPVPHRRSLALVKMAIVEGLVEQKCRL